MANLEIKSIDPFSSTEKDNYILFLTYCNMNIITTVFSTRYLAHEEVIRMISKFMLLKSHFGCGESADVTTVFYFMRFSQK